jgi:DNA-binding NarL/FixJ family response regulator
MPRPVLIVAPAGPFRNASESILTPPAFRILATKKSLSDTSPGDLPTTEPCLVVIECGESPGAVTRQITQLRQHHPLARVALAGQHLKPLDIASAFEAGVSAYFTEAVISPEFLHAIKNLITR